MKHDDSNVIYIVVILCAIFFGYSLVYAIDNSPLF
jgi:hypothetical protein